VRYGNSNKRGNVAEWKWDLEVRKRVQGFVIYSKAQAVARGAACCASPIRDRGALAISRGATTLPQQEKNNSEYFQRSRVHITGFIYAVASLLSLRCT
jgi:hypothetical protein